MIALSSGEAEYYGLVKAASAGLGFVGMMDELGCQGVRLRISTDASAGKSMAARTGTGKVRHLEVTQLWVQEKMRRGELEVRKINGQENPADKLTKYMGREGLEVHLHKTGSVAREGRSELAPQVDVQWEDNDLEPEVMHMGSGTNGRLLVELFSVPRVGPANRESGIVLGKAVDLQTGQDLRKEEEKDKVRTYIGRTSRTGSLGDHHVGR